MADPYEIAEEWAQAVVNTVEELERRGVHVTPYERKTYALARTYLAQRAVVEAAVEQEKAYTKVRASDWETVERDDLPHEAKKCVSATGNAVRAYLAEKEKT